MLSEQEIVHSISTNTLLSPAEPLAFKKVQYKQNSPIILCCDHASNRIPNSLNNLGLNSEFLKEHIAWDIGAAELTLELAKQLECTAILNNYSRLVVDCNRYLSDGSAFASSSDTLSIPGNMNLTELEKAARAEAIYYAYHRAIRRELEARTLDGNAPVLISVHSFTKQLRGQAKRELDIGVLWDKDPRLPVPLLTQLNDIKDLKVGDNQPYSGKDMADYTVDHHAEAHGIAHVSLEIRNDHLQNQDGIEVWANRLAKIFNDIFTDTHVFKQHYHNA